MQRSTRSVRILLTAAEAYPALERAFLAARSEIWASFPVFDLRTRLHSLEALCVGKTWFDLIVHTLNRGVALHICIGDVDPIAHVAAHRAATRQLRMFSAAAAVARPGIDLTVERPRHPAEAGPLIRLFTWPNIMKTISGTVGWLNKLDAGDRAAALRDLNSEANSLRLNADGTVAVQFRSFPRIYPVVHHQKLTVIDRRVLYIGGLDVDESRYGPDADPQVNGCSGNDVQLMIEGAVVVEAQEHLERFRDVIDGRLPPPKTRRLLRTLSRPLRGGVWNLGPEPVINELRTAHLVLARRASQFIYMESQCFRDIGLAKAFAQMAARTPSLHMILVLPVLADDLPETGQRGLAAMLGQSRQGRALRILEKGFQSRLFVGSPAPQCRNGYEAAKAGAAPLAHVHAKVSVFDDAAAVVSSANLDRHSLSWHTEAGVYLTLENDVIELRHRVMAHWLPTDAAQDAFDAQTAVQVWSRLAWQNAANQKGLLLPHDFATAQAHGRKLPSPPRNLN